ncbi:hypothetical protein PFISCL1PPCAC_10693, partial [Pristionchus fissidentatus]
FTRIFLFSFFFVSSLAVKECYLYSPMMPEEDVRECKNEWTHDVEKHGCYYAFNLDSSASQVGAIQGTCASYSCRTGVDQCTVSTTTQRDGNQTTTMSCCCYTELCNPIARAEAAREDVRKNGLGI